MLWFDAMIFMIFTNVCRVFAIFCRGFLLFLRFHVIKIPGGMEDWVGLVVGYMLRTEMVYLSADNCPSMSRDSNMDVLGVKVKIFWL